MRSRIVMRCAHHSATDAEPLNSARLHPIWRIQLLRSGQPKTTVSVQYWLLAAFIVLVFITGGSSRSDVQSLLILQPISILMCGVAIATLRREHLHGRVWLLGGLAVVIAVAALHVAPLPPDIWRSLPGRSDIIETDIATGLGQPWRPLTLVPANGWHALASLFAPLAVMLLGIQLNRDNLYGLMPIIIALGAISGLFGLLQAVGGADGPLYFYEITNNGSAVGLFSNRNHAAVLLACLFPMLAVFASISSKTAPEQKNRQVLAAAIAIVLVPLILVTGSRSGLLISLLGLTGAALLYRPPSPGRKVRRSSAGLKVGALPLLAGVGVVCLGFLTLFFSRATAIDRLFSQSAVEDQRGDFWLEAVDMLSRYFPWGSGSGSFAEAYRVAELPRLLDSTYLNRAHNDWLELAVTIGLPGLLFVAVMALAILYRNFLLWFRMDGTRRSVRIARMAGLIIVIIGIASFFDYPLRTPTMACIFVLSLLWFSEADGRGEGKVRSA